MKNDRVAALLQDLSLVNEYNHALVQAVRHLVLSLGKDVAEEVKYGGILFSRSQAFCGVFAYTNHISLEFGDGANLPDVYGFLEGKGKQRRHIKLTTLDEIKDRQISHYVQLAYAAAD
nr:DUF1801 domain-containing protein [uncultured Undibacterium sp.]